MLVCCSYLSLCHSLQRGGGAFWAYWHVLEINPQRTINAFQEKKFEWKTCKTIFFQYLGRFLSIKLNIMWLRLREASAKITRKLIPKILNLFWPSTTVYWLIHGIFMIHILLSDFCYILVKSKIYIWMELMR